MIDSVLVAIGETFDGSAMKVQITSKDGQQLHFCMLAESVEYEYEGGTRYVYKPADAGGGEGERAPLERELADALDRLLDGWATLDDGHEVVIAARAVLAKARGEEGGEG